MSKLAINNLEDLKDLKEIDLEGVNHLFWNLDEPIEGFCFGDEIEELSFGFSFNRSIEGLDLRKIKRLHLGYCFDQPIEKLDLQEVEVLKFSWLFNHPIENLDLKKVKELHFRWIFNQPIEELDFKGVESLYLSICFDQPIERLHLSDLRYIRFGTNFNYPISGLRPNSDLVLVFPSDSLFNQSIDNIDERLKLYLPSDFKPKITLPSYNVIPFSQESKDHPTSNHPTPDRYCNICDNREEIILTGCQHPVCYQCLSQWIKYGHTCPFCRQNIQTASLTRI